MKFVYALLRAISFKLLCSPYPSSVVRDLREVSASIGGKYVEAIHSVKEAFHVVLLSR
jgi:hypothetical protein